MNLNRLYPTHVPTSTLEKAFLTVACSITALANPLRGDMVAAVGETLGTPALRRMRVQMLSDPVGRQLLRDRPEITSASLPVDRLAALAPTTFGGAYYHNFMARHGYDADGRSPVQFVDSAELAWIVLRYRQVHDFWHTLTGIPPTVEGELALKMFEYVQTGLPMTAAAVAAAPLVQLDGTQRARLRHQLLPWAVSAGLYAKPLMCVRYEELLERDLDDVRRELRVLPAPELEPLLV
ncbi:ubiquinone biosynthesis protein Coq4, partial [Blastocladiella britannica]